MPDLEMPDLEPIVRALEGDLRAEAARRAPASLAALARLGPADAAPLPAALVSRLFARREALAAWLDAALADPRPGRGFAADPAGALADGVLRFLHQRNQFLPLDAARRAALEGVVARALRAAATALREPSEERLAFALAPVLSGFAADLGLFSRTLLSDAGFAGEAPDGIVAAEYTPELQLAVLGLEAEGLAEPILDLGCGAEARLVRALRALGKDARGIDRAAEPGDGISRAGWLEVALPPASLGTIVSHLAFSLHFVHQHLRPGGDAAGYARRYMELLRALRPGGVFAYAPGLPFVEAHLPPAAWRVERSAVPVTPPAGGVPLPWYAARVTRLR